MTHFSAKDKTRKIKEKKNCHFSVDTQTFCNFIFVYCLRLAAILFLLIKYLLRNALRAHNYGNDRGQGLLKFAIFHDARRKKATIDPPATHHKS